MSRKRVKKQHVIETDDFEAIREQVIKETMPKKKSVTVEPKSIGQQKYIDSIKNNEIVLCNGLWGTGKTHISIGLGIEYLRSGKYDQIVISRAAISACGEDQGAYPGSYQEKLMPFMLPLMEEMKHYATNQEIKKWLEEEKIRLVPIALLRGHNWNNSYVVIDEAANITFDQMVLILTRFGQNSKLIISGSFIQSDLPIYKQGAFEDFFTILKDIPGIGLCHLGKEDVVRSHFISIIMDRIEEFKKTDKIPIKYY